jgi:hypothetical protein
MASTRRSRDYREEEDVAAATAAVAAASDAATAADTSAAAIPAVAAASEAVADDTESIEATMFDFVSSVDLDDENVVAEGVDEADGNAECARRVSIG